MAVHDRKMKGFFRIHGDKIYTEELMLLSNTEPRTCGSQGQGSREWFLDRGFSGTSSTMYELIGIFAKSVMENNNDDSSNNIMGDFQKILDFCGHQIEDVEETEDPGIDLAIATNPLTNTANPTVNHTVQTSEIPNLPTTNTNPSTNATNTTTQQTATVNPSTNAANSLSNAADQLAQTTGTSDSQEIGNDILAVADFNPVVSVATDWVKKMCNTNDDAMSDDTFIDAMDDGSVSVEIMIQMLSILKRSPQRPISKDQCKIKLNEWLNSPREERPYVNLLLRQLRPIGRQKKIAGASNMNKENLIKKLAEHLKENNKRRREREQGGNDDNINLEPLACFLDKSLLRPQKDKID